MPRVHFFADESGDLDFSGKAQASRYFILTTITAHDCTAGDQLLALRRQLAWEGEPLTPDFHCTEERQMVRDRVFALLQQQTFRVDVTVLNKSKAYDRIKADEVRFYKMAWWLHFKYVAPRAVAMGDEVLVMAASIGTRKKRKLFHDAVKEVVDQVLPTSPFQTTAWVAASDPCLQLADYCSWAIQRKWELNDSRSYDLISNKIRSEFNVWK